VPQVTTPRLYICGCFDIITGYALPSLRSLRAYRGELTPSRGGMLRSLRDAPHIPPLDLKQPDSATQASLRQNAQVSSPRYRARAFCLVGARANEGGARLLSSEEVAGPGRRRLRVFGVRAQCLVRSRACVGGRGQPAVGVARPAYSEGRSAGHRYGVRKLRRARARIGRRCVRASGLWVWARTVTWPLQGTKGQCRHGSKSFGRVRFRGPRAVTRRSGDFVA